MAYTGFLIFLIYLSYFFHFYYLSFFFISYVQVKEGEVLNSLSSQASNLVGKV